MEQERSQEPPNPEMLVLARESRGLTQSELARLLSVSQGFVSKFEASLLEPSPDVVTKLGEILDYPETFFFLRDPIYGPGVTEFWHRKRQAATTRDMRRIYANLNRVTIQLSRLLRSADIPEGVWRFDLDEYQDPAEAARAVRAAWHLSPGPVKDLIGAVEAAGGIVIRCDFETRLVDAISRWVPGLPPLFFLNKDLPADRERLTLAHEVGHIVMHRMPTATMEDEAFAFAGELLMPAREISPYLAQLSLARLGSLKPAWRVSMGGLLTHATRLGTITKRQSAYLWSQMSRAGYKQREPAELDFPKEDARLLRDLIDLHRNELGYSVADLGRLFAVHQRDLMRDYPVTPTIDEARSNLRALA